MLCLRKIILWKIITRDPDLLRHPCSLLGICIVLCFYNVLFNIRERELADTYLKHNKTFHPLSQCFQLNKIAIILSFIESFLFCLFIFKVVCSGFVEYGNLPWVWWPLWQINCPVDLLYSMVNLLVLCCTKLQSIWKYENIFL